MKESPERPRLPPIGGASGYREARQIDEKPPAALSRDRFPEHEILRAIFPVRYARYEHIHVGQGESRRSFAVMQCEPVGDEFRVMAVRCLESCTTHPTKR